MPSFTVTDVSQNVRDFDSQYGPKKSYRIHLRNGDGAEHLNVELVRNAGSPAPKAGDSFEGDLEDRGQHGTRLKLANRGGMFGSIAGPRPEDPKRAARILRQHSQDMAMRAIELGARIGVIEAPTDGPALFALIARTADWFDKDAEAAAS